MVEFLVYIGFQHDPLGPPFAPNELSGPPRVSQSGVELEKNFECDFMASEDAYGSYKTYGRVRLTFGPL